MEMRKKLADASRAKISSIEGRLSGTLKVVKPRQEFVRGLGRRILSGNRAALVNRVVNWHILAALIAGFVSLAVLLAMAVRALLMLTAKKRPA